MGNVASSASISDPTLNLPLTNGGTISPIWKKTVSRPDITYLYDRFYPTIGTPEGSNPFTTYVNISEPDWEQYGRIIIEQTVELADPLITEDQVASTLRTQGQVQLVHTGTGTTDDPYRVKLPDTIADFDTETDEVPFGYITPVDNSTSVTVGNTFATGFGGTIKKWAVNNLLNFKTRENSSNVRERVLFDNLGGLVSQVAGSDDPNNVIAQLWSAAV
jgi:hypothetical protein